jgi:hypothetical protein
VRGLRVAAGVPVVLPGAVTGVPDPRPDWLPRPAYGVILDRLLAENAARTDATWEPDTPEYAAERAEITLAFLDAELAVITRDED